MKVVINTYDTVWFLSDNMVRALKLKNSTLFPSEIENLRVDPRLIKYIEERGADNVLYDGYNCFKIISIPDECTDWGVFYSPYGEHESGIVYVMDGKLNYCKRT